AEGLVKVFGRTRALDGIDLQVGAGTILGMLGPNGAGKTTTVRVLTTLLRPDLGTARVAGFDVRPAAAAAGRGVKTCSGGTRRRIDRAASLVARPSILFLDEPTTGLDPRSRVVTWDAVRALTATGTTVLLTTQHLDEADQLADLITVVDHGRVIAEGT